MSLDKCIKKAGKAISKSDADSIISKRDELVAKGMDPAQADSIAVREALDIADQEISGILDKAGVKMDKKLDPGVQIEIDGRPYDSNQFISDIDNEISGIDSIMGCLYK